MTPPFALLEQMLTDGILWLAYGIAILSALKIVVHQINGFTTESDLGTRLLEDSSFFGGALWDASPSAPPRRTPHLVPVAPKPALLPPLSAM
jgi:hypothetical protein